MKSYCMYCSTKIDNAEGKNRLRCQTCKTIRPVTKKKFAFDWNEISADLKARGLNFQARGTFHG